MWSGSSSSSATDELVRSGAASTVITTAPRAARAGPRLPVTARATAKTTTIRYVRAEAAWAAKLPSPNSNSVMAFSGSSKK